MRSTLKEPLDHYTVGTLKAQRRNGYGSRRAAQKASLPGRLPARKAGGRGIIVFLVVVTVFTVFPVYWAALTALKPASEAISFPPQFYPRHPTFDNFVEIVQAYTFQKYVLNTTLVCFGTILLSLAVSSYGAYALSRYDMPYKRLIMVMIIATSMVPGISIVLPLYLLAVKLGIYNTLGGLVVVYAAWVVPSELWFLKAMMDQVPIELEEAAIIDGCSRLGAFHRITLPSSILGIVSVSIYAFVRVWNDFLFSTALVISDDRKLVSVALYNFLSQFGVQWTQLMSAVVLSSIPVVAFFVVLQRYYVSGFTSGAVKG